MTFYSVDTSAWHRSVHSSVAATWRRLLATDDLGICDQVRLEILYSARSAREYETLAEELSALRPIDSDASTYRRALEVQLLLARRAALHHRSVKIADLLIAAAAEAGRATVLHYDADFDRIAEVTGQPMEWIAPRGSI